MAMYTLSKHGRCPTEFFYYQAAIQYFIFIVFSISDMNLEVNSLYAQSQELYSNVLQAKKRGERTVPLGYGVGCISLADIALRSCAKGENLVDDQHQFALILNYLSNFNAMQVTWALLHLKYFRL